MKKKSDVVAAMGLMGAKFIAQEIIFLAILRILARAEPANASLLVQAIEEFAGRKDLPPGTAEELRQYQEMLRGEIRKRAN